jgi:hypothetical protein
MRICASVRSDTSSTPAMCISFPHRHSGPSVQSGANSRSNEDMQILTTNGTSLHCMHYVCSTSLTFRHGWPLGFRIKRRELNWAATEQKRKVPTAPQRRDLRFHTWEERRSNASRITNSNSDARVFDHLRRVCCDLLYKSHTGQPANRHVTDIITPRNLDQGLALRDPSQGLRRLMSEL